MAKNKKIWIADDDESIRFVLESGLSEAGFNVSTFEDGNEVVNKLDIESPHLLLTDLKMPGRDGMDLLETFRNEHQKIPIIIKINVSFKIMTIIPCCYLKIITTIFF